MTRQKLRNPLGTREAVRDMLARGEITKHPPMGRIEAFLERHPLIAGVVIAICAYEILGIIYIIK